MCISCIVSVLGEFTGIKCVAKFAIGESGLPGNERFTIFREVAMCIAFMQFLLLPDVLIVNRISLGLPSADTCRENTSS